jgi:general stress protein 26
MVSFVRTMMLLASDPAALAIVRHAMVVRLATLSRNGRPSITPIYFIVQEGHIWIGTVEWTLAVRAARADPRVSLLFTWERNPGVHQTVRMIGTAVIRTDPSSLRRYNASVAMKYILTPGGLWSYLTHVHKLGLLHRYHIQDDEKGEACIIDVTPEQIVVLEG